MSPFATVTGRRTVRSYLLDSHAMVRAGLRTLLEAEPDIEVVGESGDAVAGLRAIHRTRPDVVVIDAQFGGDGIAVCRRLHQELPTLRTLVLSDLDSNQVVEALDAGASGYVLRSIKPRALLNSVRAVASGHSVVDTSLTSHLIGRRETPVDRVLASLTPREQHVLDLVSQGLTNKQIAASINLSEHTVKNHVTNVLAKLGVKRRAHAAVLAAKSRSR